MVAWMDRTERVDRTERHRSRVARRRKAAAHGQYVWDAGFRWGEWLVPGDETQKDFGALTSADKGDVATAFYAHNSRLMTRIAELTGRLVELVRKADTHLGTDRVPQDSVNQLLEGGGCLFLHRCTAGIELLEPGLPAVPDQAPARRWTDPRRGRARVAVRAEVVCPAGSRDRRPR
jgi:hypothetical protein